MTFSLFEIFICNGWWVTLFELDIPFWHGSFIMVGRTDQGEWEFDLLFLRTLFHRIVESLKVFEGDE